jgi:hypothetical protein
MHVSELIYDRQRLERDAEVTQANAAATHLVPRADADALRLVITGTYDGQFPPNTGNVQIAEVRVSGDEP